MLQVQIPHFENHWPGVYEASKPSWQRMPLRIWSLPPTLSSTVTTYWHSLRLSFIHSFGKYVPDAKSTIILGKSEAWPTFLPLLLLLAFLKWRPLSPSFPAWLTSNSSKFYVKGQLLGKSSPSPMRASTPILPGPTFYHCTYLIVFQLFLYKFRLWGTVTSWGIDCTSFF